MDEFGGNLREVVKRGAGGRSSAFRALKVY